MPVGLQETSNDVFIVPNEFTDILFILRRWDIAEIGMIYYHCEKQRHINEAHICFIPEA